MCRGLGAEVTTLLDAPLLACPCCGVDLVWHVSHGYHRSECACGWIWCGPTPATARTVLGVALDRFPALRDQVLGAMEWSLAKADEKRRQDAEVERLRVAARERAATHPCIIPGCVGLPALGAGLPCLPHVRAGHRLNIGPARGERRAWTRDEAVALARALA